MSFQKTGKAKIVEVKEVGLALIGSFKVVKSTMIFVNITSK